MVSRGRRRTQARSLRPEAERASSVAGLDHALAQLLVAVGAVGTELRISNPRTLLYGFQGFSSDEYSDLQIGPVVGNPPITVAKRILASIPNMLASASFANLGTELLALLCHDVVRDALIELQALLEIFVSGYAKRIIDSTTTTESAIPASLVAPSSANIAANSSYQSWSEIFASSFDRPEPMIAAEEARKFLHGFDRGKWWTAVHVALDRCDEVASIISRAEGSPVVFVHGPVGEGKTTLIRQTAWAWLAKGRRVFLLKSQDALDDPNFLQEMQWLDRPLLILDDIRLTKAVLPWFTPGPDSTGGCLLIGTQSRGLASQRGFASGLYSLYPVSCPKRQDAEAYVKIIEENGAGRPGVGRAELIELFIDGLGLRGGGGLWCAQWQATRGEYLAAKIEALVDELAEDPHELGALAAITFVNCLKDFSDQRLSDLRRSQVEYMIRQLDLTEDACGKRIDRVREIGALLEGEFLRDGIDLQSDPQMELRHPIVVHAFLQQIFGGRLESHGRLRDQKWRYFVALGQAYASIGNKDALLTIMRQHEDAWEASRPQTHFHGGMYDHPRLKTARELER